MRKAFQHTLFHHSLTSVSAWPTALTTKAQPCPREASAASPFFGDNQGSRAGSLLPDSAPPPCADGRSRSRRGRRTPPAAASRILGWRPRPSRSPAPTTSARSWRREQADRGHHSIVMVGSATAAAALDLGLLTVWALWVWSGREDAGRFSRASAVPVPLLARGRRAHAPGIERRAGSQPGSLEGAMRPHVADDAATGLHGGVAPRIEHRLRAPHRLAVGSHVGASKGG